MPNLDQLVQLEWMWFVLRYGKTDQRPPLSTGVSPYERLRFFAGRYFFIWYWFYNLNKFKANQAIGLNFSDIDAAKVSCRGPNIRFKNLTTSISAVQSDEIPCFNKCGASRQIARDPLFLIVNGGFNDWKRDRNFNGVFKKINRNKIPKAIDKTGNRSVYK